MTPTPTLTVRVPRRLRSRASSENLRAAIRWWEDSGVSLPPVREPRFARVCFSLRGVSREKLDRLAAGQGMKAGELLCRLFVLWAARKGEERGRPRVAARPASVHPASPVQAGCRAAEQTPSREEPPVRLDWQSAASLLKRAGALAAPALDGEFSRVGSLLVERIGGEVSRSWRLPSLEG